MKLVALKVPIPTGAQAPTQKLEPGEHIIRRIVELSKLKAELDGMGSIITWYFVTEPHAWYRLCSSRVCSGCEALALCLWMGSGK
jgi:hypothetical protein